MAGSSRRLMRRPLAAGGVVVGLASGPPLWLELWRRGLRAGRDFQKVSRAAAEKSPPPFTLAANNSSAILQQ